MSDHQRKLIRKKVVDLLKRPVAVNVYPTDARQRVFSSRITPYWENEFPAISVYNGPDRVTVLDEAPRRLQHDFTVIVEVVTKVTDDLDDELDDIARQVERVISINDTLEGCAADILLDNSSTTLRENGEQLIGSCKIEFSCEYYTDWPEAVDLEAAGIVTDFDRANTQYSLNNEQAEADRAKDNIEVQTE